MVEAIPCIDEVFDQIIDAVLNGQKLSGPPLTEPLAMLVW